MTRPTIDYLNARRAAIAAGAGGAVRSDRLANPAAARERARTADVFEQVAERLAALFRNERQIIAEYRRRAQGGSDDSF